MFDKNKHVTDPRVIDMLVIKVKTTFHWCVICIRYNYFNFLIDATTNLVIGVSANDWFMVAQYLIASLMDLKSHRSWTSEDVRYCTLEQHYTVSCWVRWNIFHFYVLYPPGENGTTGNNPRLEAEDPRNALFPRDRGSSSCWLPVQILPGSWPMNCGYLMTSDLFLLVSSVTDVPLGCKYTLNTHIPMAVSFLFRITVLLGFLKGTLQPKTHHNLIAQWTVPS